MKKRNIALLSLFLLSGLTISAQEVLTLEQCKKLALENNCKNQECPIGTERFQRNKERGIYKLLPYRKCHWRLDSMLIREWQPLILWA